MQDGVESYITGTTCTRRATSLFINMAKATCCRACLPFNLCPHAGPDTLIMACLLPRQRVLRACARLGGVACFQGSCLTILGVDAKTHLPEIHVYPYIMRCENHKNLCFWYCILVSLPIVSQKLLVLHILVSLHIIP